MRSPVSLIVVGIQLVTPVVDEVLGIQFRWHGLKSQRRLIEVEAVGEIAGLLQEQMGLSRWWSQMVAVGYENERGIRQDERGEPPGKRYEVTLSKIVAAPRVEVWAAWQDRATLARWLPNAEFQVSRTVPQKVLHLDWPDETRVAVRLYERRGKTRVVVSHKKLAEGDAERLQDYWSEALDRLRVMVAR